MPVPARLTVTPALIVKVKALALALNNMLSRSVVCESDILRTLEVLNVAVSENPLGTVAGVQFAAVCQFPLLGAVFHVALPA
jgi:hypothetical protein